jgi:hypothetical protein
MSRIESCPSSSAKPIYPKKLAQSVGGPLAGAKNGKTAGMRLNIAQNAVAVAGLQPQTSRQNRGVLPGKLEAIFCNLGQRVMLAAIGKVLILLCFVLMGLSQPVLAAETSSGLPTAPEEVASPASNNPTASDISSEKVSQFIQCYLQVLELVEQREPIVNAAETELEAKQLEKEVEAAALALIEQSGLTLPEYFQLLGLANSDAEFSERITAQLQEAD